MSTATNIKAIASALPAELMQQLDIDTAALVSPRTIKITLKTPAPDGTNQIKVTVEGGKFLVRGYRFEETAMFYDLPSAAVADTIKAMATGKNEAADSVLASALKKAAGK